MLTSWMSSPSRNSTGFSVSRWSSRNVVGSARQVTMHLTHTTRIQLTNIIKYAWKLLHWASDENTAWTLRVGNYAGRRGLNWPVGIVSGLRGGLHSVGPQQLNHYLGGLVTGNITHQHATLTHCNTDYTLLLIACWSERKENKWFSSETKNSLHFSWFGYMFQSVVVIQTNHSLKIFWTTLSYLCLAETKASCRALRNTCLRTGGTSHTFNHFFTCET